MFESTDIMAAIAMIEATSGKNDKQALLAKFMEDDAFAHAVRSALDPFITFGIRPSRIPDSVPAGERDMTVDDWAVLDQLRFRKLTGNAAAQAVNDVMTELNGPSRELFWRIVNKDLKAGFGENSVNKAKKGFFQTFPYMRCSLPKDTDLSAWDWASGIISQVKADGMFVNARVEDIASLITRQGQPIPEKGFEKLLENLRKLPAGYQYSGEMLVVDAQGKIAAREIGNGMINKACSGNGFPEGYFPVVQFWDMVPLAEVKPKAKYKVIYAERLKKLNAAIKGAEVRFVGLIETKIVRSLKEAYAHYALALSRGEEGTILKKPTLDWKDGTSKDQIKLKLEVPVELEVEGFEEGKEGSKTEATFGSLRCKSSCGLLKVNVGSGFTDALREEINNDREGWTGAIITAKANSIMYSDDLSKKAHSLFLPIFLDRRHDKTEADSFERIVEQFDNAVKPQ